ncbi:MAG: hypothetical protein HQL06_03315 [Nitrospirae bacterium]|nr:hypothetical protein [Nitrospirota bacterium]
MLAILCKTDDEDDTIKTIVGKISVLPPKEAKDYCLKLLYLSSLKKLYNRVKNEVDNMPITFDIRESEIFLDGMREGLIDGIEMVLEIKYGSNGLELMDMVRNIEAFEKLNQLKVAIKRSDTVEELRTILVDMIG